MYIHEHIINLCVGETVSNICQLTELNTKFKLPGGFISNSCFLISLISISLSSRSRSSRSLASRSCLSRCNSNSSLYTIEVHIKIQSDALDDLNSHAKYNGNDVHTHYARTLVIYRSMTHIQTFLLSQVDT